MKIYKHKLKGEYIKLYYKPNWIQKVFLNKCCKVVKYKILESTYKYSRNNYGIIRADGKEMSIIDKEVDYINNVIRQSNF